MTVGYLADKVLFKQYKSRAQVSSVQKNGFLVIDTRYWTSSGQSGSPLLYWQPNSYREEYGQYIVCGVLCGSQMDDFGVNFDHTIWIRITPLRYHILEHLINGGPNVLEVKLTMGDAAIAAGATQLILMRIMSIIIMMTSIIST